jgi:hypothetical protein
MKYKMFYLLSAFSIINAIFYVTLLQGSIYNMISIEKWQNLTNDVRTEQLNNEKELFAMGVELDRDSAIRRGYVGTSEESYVHLRTISVSLKSDEDRR